MTYKVARLFDLTHTLACDYLKKFEYPWQALGGIGELILELGNKLGGEYVRVNDNIWVHNTAEVAPTAYIGAPSIICAHTQVRHCAYIRGSVLIGEGCVVGNSTELKNVILFDGVQAPHFNYVGDSILGYKAHMGAGAITSNVKMDKSQVEIFCNNTITTGRKKVGAMLGDGVEIGCNSVLSPGTVIGKNTYVYPLSFVRGVVKADSIYKGKDCIVAKR